MMALPPLIVADGVPRQTLPYGDRPFVGSGGHLTPDAYQYLQRLAQGFGATVSNVSVVISTTNTVVANLAGILTSIATIEAEVAAIEVEIASLAPPSPAAGRGGGIGAAQAFGLAFFFGGP